MPANRKRKESAPKGDVDTIDEWVKEMEPFNGCRTCTHKGASTTIKRLLEAMVRNNASHITVKQIHAKVQELNPDYKIGYWGFRDHLYNHEKELYSKAKGRDA